MAAPDLDTVVSLAKRRGFIYPSAEIYGGFANTYDYGPLGVELKRNIRNAWWKSMVQDRDDVVGLDAALISNPNVWVASGHVANFGDPLVDCKKCKSRFRLDHLEEGDYGPVNRDANGKPLCPNDGGELTEPRQFNLMFRTQVGPVEESSSIAYLPPETAQGIFINFENVVTSMRRKLPLGIAQARTSFRNEITPGRWVFRTLEFDQMELEYFTLPPKDREHPAEYLAMYYEWVQARRDWYVDVVGIDPDRLRLRPHEASELSHYSIGTTDVEYLFPWGWGELEGIAQRTDYDLKQHSEHSGEKLDYFDQANNERYVPYVIEPAAGATRTMAAFMLAAYDEDEIGGEARTVLRLHPRLAPYKVAVLPLSKKETLVPLAKRLFRMLSDRYMCDYDDTQSIGRRYRRQDEIGTPLCVTVDFDSLDDDAVTIRERDTTEQVRVPVSKLVHEVSARLAL